MLNLAPHLVRMREIPKEGATGASGSEGKMLADRAVKRYVNIKEFSEVGVDGDPAAASREDGERFYQAVLQALEEKPRAILRLPA